MTTRRGSYSNYIALPGVKTERHLQALEAIESLEDIQGVNDDVLDLLASCNRTIENTMERLFKQNDVIDTVIERITKGGVFYG